MMTWSRVFLGVILLSAFPGPTVGGRSMPKLADWKLCADEECSCKSWGWGWGAWIASLSEGITFPISSPDPSHAVQGDYYGDLAARLGFFPSSIVREDQTLKPGKIDVKTDKWDFYCQ
ncbi:melanoma-derived growth regulatory protein [Myotis lucifugus]|uniref:melanoma-derived growth regulatory protein n=1 Tax=Myotis lucifugus TaxID=59463 RepID=UPI000CCC6004|nr:melanoma-derived growth regulatory protein [Myotis lucifugus]